MIKTKICLFSLCLLLVTSCTKNTDNFQSITSIPTTPTISVYGYISNSNYMKGCVEINPLSTSEQANYKDIYPNITSIEETRNTLGDPKDTFHDSYADEEYWYYGNGQNIVSVSFVNDKVNRIEITYLKFTDLSLLDIVKTYGCADMIQAIDRSEHSSGNYDVIVFCYPEIGVEFWFDFKDIKLTSSPSEIRYFNPIKLDEYILSFNGLLSVNNPFIKPVYWSEVVNNE